MGSASSAPHFVQGMGLFSATAIVMGSMIGSGIFIVSADMSRTLGSPALLIAAWLVTAAMTMIGALSYGELAAMMPKAGGQYVYLRESLGPIWGFLYGWTLFLVIQTGTIAAVGVAFGKFLGVFFPSISQTHWLWHVGSGNVGLSTVGLTAIVIITLLTLLNTRGIKLGAAVQNVFTSAKVLALLGVIAVGLVAKSAAAIAANFGNGRSKFWSGAGVHTAHPLEIGSFLGLGGGSAVVGIFTVIAVVQVGSLFSSDAWNNVTFTAGEIKNPKRNLPLSLALGTGVVLMLYIACNFVYLSVLPLAAIQSAPQDRVATAVMQVALGSMGAKLMAAAILVSTFGCVNGMLLAGARVYYAMSRDGLFFQSVGKLDAKDRCAAQFAVDAVGVDVPAVSFGQLWPVAGLCDLRGAGVLCADDCGVVRAAAYAAGHAETVQGLRVSGAAGAVHRDGDMDLCCTLAVQASIHLAGTNPGFARIACVLGMDAEEVIGVRVVAGRRKKQLLRYAQDDKSVGPG